MSAHFPSSGHTEQTIKVISEDWHDELKNLVPDERFVYVMKLIRKETRFFPCLADFLRVNRDNTFQGSCSICVYKLNGLCEKNNECKNFAKG